jgi:hypothetical protein
MIKKLIPRKSFFLFTKDFSAIAQPLLDIISQGFQESKVFPLFFTLSFNGIILETPTFFKYLKRLFYCEPYQANISSSENENNFSIVFYVPSIWQNAVV